MPGRHPVAGEGWRLHRPDLCAPSGAPVAFEGHFSMLQLARDCEAVAKGIVAYYQKFIDEACHGLSLITIGSLLVRACRRESVKS